MGFDVALLAYFDEPGSLDLRCPVESGDLNSRLVRRLFPRTSYGEAGAVSLMEGGFPSNGDLNVGTFDGGALIAARGAHLYNPSKLHGRYLKRSDRHTVVLLTQRAYNDMFAYGRWVDGVLKRAISVNPVGKVWENIGIPESFEKPFWNGEHPVGDAYPLPFHPLELSDAALRSVLNLLYEGPPDPHLSHPEEVLLREFRREAR